MWEEKLSSDITQLNESDTFSSLMDHVNMLSKGVSWPQRLLAKIASDGKSLYVFRLNVMF